MFADRSTDIRLCSFNRLLDCVNEVSEDTISRSPPLLAVVVQVHGPDIVESVKKQINQQISHLIINHIQCKRPEHRGACRLCVWVAGNLSINTGSGNNRDTLECRYVSLIASCWPQLGFEERDIPFDEGFNLQFIAPIDNGWVVTVEVVSIARPAIRTASDVRSNRSPTQYSPIGLPRIVMQKAARGGTLICRSCLLKRKTIASTSWTECDTWLSFSIEIFPKAWHNSSTKMTFLDSQCARTCMAGLVGAFSEGVPTCWTSDSSKAVFSDSQMDLSGYLVRAEVRDVSRSRKHGARISQSARRVEKMRIGNINEVAVLPCNFVMQNILIKLTRNEICAIQAAILRTERESGSGSDIAGSGQSNRGNVDYAD
ncbi:hypothetical protein KCU81_g189, partial [Aureobasidium melanogenum]